MSAGKLHAFSAKGAAFIDSLGQRPRITGNLESRALKARLIPALIGVGSQAHRRIESRFQRLFTTQSKSWDDAPGWHEGAPLALKI